MQGFRFHKNGLGIILALIFAFTSCAEKPKKKIADGQDNNLYKKSELENQAFVVKELSGKMELLVRQVNADDIKEVSFKVTKLFLTMYKGASSENADDAVYQFAIKEHWDLMPEANKDDIKTSTSSETIPAIHVGKIGRLLKSIHMIRRKSEWKCWKVRGNKVLWLRNPKSLANALRLRIKQNHYPK